MKLNISLNQFWSRVKYSISLYFYNKINRNTLKIWLILLWCKWTHSRFIFHQDYQHVVSCLIWPRPSHLHRNKPSDWHVKQPTSFICMWCLKVSEIVDITIIKLCVKKTCKYGVPVFANYLAELGEIWKPVSAIEFPMLNSEFVSCNSGKKVKIVRYKLIIQRK